MANTLISATQEAEAGESLETGEAEIAVSQDYVIALQPGQQEQNSTLKIKIKNKKNKTELIFLLSINYMYF